MRNYNDTYANTSDFPLKCKRRGSQIRIVIRSVLQLGSNGIKLSMFFLGADQGIKMNSEQLVISTDQCIFSDAREAWQRFCPSPIKSSDQEPRREWSSNQVQLSLIKFLDSGCKHYYGRHVRYYPLCKVHVGGHYIIPLFMKEMARGSESYTLIIKYLKFKVAKLNVFMYFEHQCWNYPAF